MHGGGYGYGGGGGAAAYMNHSSSSRNDGTMQHPPQPHLPQHHTYLSGLSPAGPSTAEYDPSVATLPNATDHNTRLPPPSGGGNGGASSSSLYLTFLSANYGGGGVSTEPTTQQYQLRHSDQRLPHASSNTPPTTNGRGQSALPGGNLHLTAPSVFETTTTHRFSSSSYPLQEAFGLSSHLDNPPRGGGNHSYAGLQEELYLSSQQQQVLLRSNMCSPLSFDVPFFGNAMESNPAAGVRFAPSDPVVNDPLAPHSSIIHNSLNTSSDVLQREPWMDEIHLEVSAISLTPMTGYEIANRIQEKLQDILDKYIPCVNFLVQCQQDLRKGLEYITTAKQFAGRHKQRQDSNAKQFYASYIEPLARSFYNDNQHRIDEAALKGAIEGLLQLQSDAKKVERQGCEAVKSSYLGGMKDGESWGLRKWLSRHGGALQVCTDLECILSACQQQLDRTAVPTQRLAALLRPRAQHVLNRLQKDIPPSYQQHSSAHPYLPFFHRLESALRGLSQFDPEKEDDVICVDDSDDDEVVAVEVVVRESTTDVKKRGWNVATAQTNDLTDEILDGDDDWVVTHAAALIQNPLGKRARRKRDATPRRTALTNDDGDGNSSSGESEVESIVEIVDIMGESDVGGGESSNDWACPSCSMINVSGDTNCLACGEERYIKDLLNFSRLDDFFDGHKVGGGGVSFDYGGGSSSESASVSKPPLWPVPMEQPELQQAAALVIANNLERIACMFDQNQQSSIRSLRLPEGSFWDGERYACALRLFAQILRSPESFPFLECVDDDRLIRAGNSPLFSHVIKHPLSLRLIARAILGDESQSTQNGVDGFLSVRGLNNWNMWFGKDLLQAIDLVFLNSLAYGNALNQGKSQYRSSTNQLRKKFWNGITDIVEGADSERRKQCMPTRRAEKSGFVVYKIGESGG